MEIRCGQKFMVIQVLIAKRIRLIQRVMTRMMLLLVKFIQAAQATEDALSNVLLNKDG